MIRVLIVEDEPPIARAVARLVERHPAFEVAGVEYEGEAAMKRLAEESIDVIITDIRMPIMDGLTLLQNVHSRYPEVFTVILSGYQIFSYAKAAIEYQAFDYLLKPITKERLFAVLDKIETAWASQNLEQKRRQIVRAMGGESVEGTGAEDCYALLICAGSFPQAGADLLLPGQVFWNETDYEGWLSERLRGGVLTFNGSHNTEKIVVAEFPDAASAAQTAGELFDYLNAAGSIPVTVVGHSAAVGVPLLGRVISRLRTILYQEIRLFRPLLVWRDCMAPNGSQPAQIDRNMPLEAAVEAITAGNEERLAEVIRLSLELSRDSDETQVDYVRFLDSILNDSRLTYRVNSKEYTDVKLELSVAIANMVELDSLSRNLASILITLGGETESKRDMKQTVDLVEEYLQANYNKPISSELLSSKFGFVPSYLSKQFRKYKNASPSEYLVQLRIEKAKELMRGQPEMLVRDIAVHVGYSDPHYFSKIFKRETGIWPTEYQQKNTAAK